MSKLEKSFIFMQKLSFINNFNVLQKVPEKQGQNISLVPLYRIKICRYYFLIAVVQ
jgi:hypothetical protein